MITLDFDTSGIDKMIQKLSPDLSLVGQTMDLVGGYIANTWEAAASGVILPGMTRAISDREYANSVEHHLHGELEVEVGANNNLTEKLSKYIPPRDMKPKILAGPKAKIAKDGSRYNVIPLRHKMGQLSGDAMWALATEARNFQTMVGMRSKTLPSGTMTSMNEKGQYAVDGRIGISATRYTWSTGHESGIRWGNNGPVTFRTVSDKSAPASWWYPARAENPIIDAVWNAVKDDVQEWVFNAWLEVIRNANNAGQGFNS